MLIPATGRQGELKRRTFVGIRCRPQTAVVILNNRAADRESHAHSLWLGGIESIEDLVEIL